MTMLHGIIFGALLAFIPISIFYLCRELPRIVSQRRQEALQVFSTALELRFPSQAGWTHRVRSLTTATAREMGYDDNTLRNLELGSSLRMIGLCAVPWRLVNDSSPLTWSPAEKATYDQHPDIGAAMLELVPSLRHLAPMVRYYRTAFDGSDGPLSPSRTDIPFESRVLHAAEAYLFAEQFQGASRARQILIEQKSSQFDPAVVDALLQVLPSLSSEEQGSSGEGTDCDRDISVRALPPDRW